MTGTMRVLKAQGDSTAQIEEVAVPTCRPDYILIKTIAVALNPTDWKHMTYLKTKTTLGCDYAGVVVEIGPEVTKPYKKGDRVFGFAHGGNKVYPSDGAFGGYLEAKGDVQMKIPDHMSFEEAASMGVGILTCGQGMYQAMKAPLFDQPSKEKLPILIYGGSTSTGVYAIQFAKLSGFEVLTTCSPRNFDLVKSFGADVCFDYKEADIGSKIRTHTNNKLYYAFDTISESGSNDICSEALSSDSSIHALQYGAILRSKTPREDVLDHHTLGYTIIGEYFDMFGTAWPPKPQDFEFMKGFMLKVQKLLDEKKLKPHKVVVKGGLDDVYAGMLAMKNGEVSGCKWVYTIGKE